jgi:hypothetical protein
MWRQKDDAALTFGRKLFQRKVETCEAQKKREDS